MSDKFILDPSSLAVQTFVADSGYVVAYEGPLPSEDCMTDEKECIAASNGGGVQ